MCVSCVSADPDGVGQGRVLSQTQTEAQTGASHQPDVWEQLRGGGEQTDRWMDGWIDRWGMGKRNRGKGNGTFVFLNC